MISHRPGLWKCVDCRKQFTVTVGTPFERSKVPLCKWLMAAYLLSSSRKGISAQLLHGTLGVTYKTAWRMARRIRGAMLQQNPHLVLTAQWLQWILLGEQKRRSQETAMQCRTLVEATCWSNCRRPQARRARNTAFWQWYCGQSDMQRRAATGQDRKFRPAKCPPQS
jgi:hypothetical protein